ncbi:hypothetical protein DY000_02046612 [Brassica cretica]|uniref:Uncharacterized protein n=1 Tax=Brassica cretica TaxID=69181 RepID=A0ABQ7EU71_BRACR|nr:hypothetical protein DY000_02046612 [Brassica cretica]
MHAYGMGPGSKWSMENWPCSPGELIRGTIELARRASWLVSRPSSPGDPFWLFVFSAFEVLTEIRFF